MNQKSASVVAKLLYIPAICMNMSDVPASASGPIFTLLFGLRSGRIGSFIVLFFSILRERRREKEINNRAAGMVLFELATLLTHVARYRMIADGGVDGNMPLPEGSVDAVKEDELLEGLEFPKMSTGIKPRAFNFDTLTELDYAYVEIRAMTATNAHSGPTANMERRLATA